MKRIAKGISSSIVLVLSAMLFLSHQPATTQEVASEVQPPNLGSFGSGPPTYYRTQSPSTPESVEIQVSTHWWQEGSAIMGIIAIINIVSSATGYTLKDAINLFRRIK